MKENRLRRIFAPDGRSVIVACDHPSFQGPLPGLEDPGKLMDILAGCGVDGVLTTMGVASRFASRMGRLGLILRVDGGSSSRAKLTGSLRKQFSVEDAVRLGADAVICMGMIGFAEEPSTLANLADLVSESARWNVPVVAEMLVKPADGAGVTVEDVNFAMRIGIELGADIIKTSFARPAEEYARALRACYRPVLVLGGEKAKNDLAILESVAEAMDCGAKGVAIGRNVWGHPDPAGICRALVALVHDGASVGQAVKEIAV